MNGSLNRTARRSKAARRVRTSLLASTAAAAMTLGLAPTPAANAAIPVTVDIDPVYTAGTLASLLNFVGNEFPGRTLGGLYNSGPPQTVGTSLWLPYSLPLKFTIPIPGFGNISIDKILDLTLDINAALYLNNLKRTGTESLFNTLGSIPQPSTNTGCGGKTLGGPKNDSAVDSNPATSCRYSAMLATSEATLNLVNAFRAQIASLQDPANTPAGYLKFEPAPGSTVDLPTETNQFLAFLQNPVRPNGGFLSRFPGLSSLLGQDPTMPAAGLYKSPDGTTTLNTTTVDATWAYDPMADFPAVFNIFAVLNSLDAFLPLNLVGGIGAPVLTNDGGATASATDIGLGLASLFQVEVSPVPIPEGLDFNGLNQLRNFYLPMAPGQAYYATIVPKQLPILSYMRLPSLIINQVLSALGAPFRVGTPWSDALEPALKILVNIAYDDVIAPDELDTVDPNSKTNQTYAEEGYQAYDRTFMKASEVTPFGSVNPLTREQRAQVPGDVFRALGSGLWDLLTTPLLGYIVPAPSATASSSSAVAARSAATADSAAAESDAAPDVPAPAPVAAGAPASTPSSAVRATRGRAEAHARASARKQADAATASSDDNDAPKAAASGSRRGTR